MVAWGELLLRQLQGTRDDFACGVRFMRFRSAWFSGCASRSAHAASSMAPGLIGLGVGFEVVLLLISCCPTGRNNANALVSFGVGYERKNLRFGHAG